MGTVYFNQPLELQARDGTPDGAGGRVGDWQTLGTLWGAISPRTGREMERGTVRVGRTPVTVKVRAMPIGAPERPVAGQRFRLGPRVFRILAVAEADGTGRVLRCFCEEEWAA